MRIATRILADTTGATAIEYALITGLIAMAMMGGMGLAGNALANTLFTASKTMDTAPALVAKH